MKLFLFLIFLSLNIHAEEMGVGRTYFMGGALFTGEKDLPVKATFSQVLIKSFRSILNPDEFKIVQSSILKPGMGIFCLNRGIKPLKKPHRHRIVGDVIDEILADYPLDPNGTINLIGSSYGSVVSSQVALYFLKNNVLPPNTRITLTLSANAIAHDSELYLELLKFHDSEKAAFTLTDLSDARDPLVGAIGSSRKKMRKNVRALLKLLKAKGPKAVFGAHFKGMNDMKRVQDIIETVLIKNAGHGDEIARATQTFMVENKIEKISSEIKERFTTDTLLYLDAKGYRKAN